VRGLCWSMFDGRGVVERTRCLLVPILAVDRHYVVEAAVVSGYMGSESVK